MYLEKHNANFLFSAFDKVVKGKAFGSRDSMNSTLYFPKIETVWAFPISCLILLQL